MTTAEQVSNRAANLARSGKDVGVGMCLRFVRSCAGAPGGTRDAITAWRQARHRHGGGTPPRGSFVFWSGGREGHGHVAVSDGRGYIWSTDILRAGKVDRVTISHLGARWPGQSYLGWSEDVNGVRIPGLAPASPLLITASKVTPGQQNDDVRAFQLALRRAGFAKHNPSGASGYFGRETRAMVKAAQRVWAGSKADGLVGIDTLRRLGFAIKDDREFTQ